jgi:hypothetical protein
MNFDWSANTDGSYNCSVSILGPGGMVESLRINNPVKVDMINQLQMKLLNMLLK